MTVINRRDLFIAALVLPLALFGGVQFYYSWPGPLFVGVLGGYGLLAYARGARPALLRSALVLWSAAVLAALVNLDIYPVTVSRLLLGAAAIGALGLFYGREVFGGLYLAGLLWPGVYLLGRAAGWDDSANVLGAWSVLFLAVGLRGRKWLYILPHAALLIYLGSRGALLGALAVLIVYLWPVFRYKTLYPVLPVLAGLMVWRWDNTLVRLHYWASALGAVSFFGVGPGGLWARQIITEPGSSLYQIHAHNIFITWLAETGPEGCIIGGVALLLLPRLHYQRWQAAIIAGLLAQSMVDEPLFWPGLMIVFAMVLSNVNRETTGNR